MHASVKAGDRRQRQGVLAVSLIVVELIAGMQVYSAQAVLPVLSSQLGGKNLYGVVTGASRIAGFAALPVGAALVARTRIPRLLTVLTAGLVLGAVVSATAGSMLVYGAGLVVRAFAGGCLAAVSMGTVAIGLRGRWRRIALACMSGVWIISSILGPVYASWVMESLNWRWAIVLYLPFLLAGRWVIALHLNDSAERRGTAVRMIEAVPLACGLALVSLPVGSGALRGAAMLIGAALLVAASVRILPRGTFALAGPRRSALATLYALTAVYFAVDAVIAILVHDLLGAGPAGIGLVLTGGGLAWALVGFACGLRPAGSRRRYLARVVVGTGLIVVGTLGLSAVLLVGSITAIGWWWPAVCWAVAGAGMGLIYVDTLTVIFDEPSPPDGLSQTQVGPAATIAEGVASALTATLATSFVAAQLGRGDPGRHAITLALAVVAVAALGLIPVAVGRSNAPAGTIPRLDPDG